MAVSFLSLPLSLSLFLVLTLLLAHAGRTHLSGLSQPKLDFCSCVFSFVCFFFFLFTCLSLLVSLSVPHICHPKWRGLSPHPAKGSPGVQQLPTGAAGPSLQCSILRAFGSGPAGAWSAGKWCPYAVALHKMWMAVNLVCSLSFPFWVVSRQVEQLKCSPR